MDASNQKSLIDRLREWRDATAVQQKKEAYRVLPNSTLEALATLRPKTLTELQTIKGIKSVKSRQYGAALLKLINDTADLTSSLLPEVDTSLEETSLSVADSIPQEPLTISEFLDGLNLELSGMAARIRGEVTSVDVRERVVYFSLKDEQDGSVLACLIFRYQYEVAGVTLTLGDEVILEGAPDIYKPSGRLSFRAFTIEYAGEGALKKAYDELYAKLEHEGLFSLEKKRLLPAYPERIALITSSDGAALGDFMSNLTRAGLHITLFPTLVEGKRAVFEILNALRYFNNHADQFDTIVMIRGGGSLESLQAFNTESLVRAVAQSKLPVLAGIGHERDISLVALAADAMVSTPTATAKTISASWDEARQEHERYGLFLSRQIEILLRWSQDSFVQYELFLQQRFEQLSSTIDDIQQSFREQLTVIPERLRSIEEILYRLSASWTYALERTIRGVAEELQGYELRLKQYHPNRALRLGYSLVRKQGEIVRRAEHLALGDQIDIELGSGTIEAAVTKIP